ncbi:hypothetical protein [Cerasicoccus frondis]|uniref:hypothetical protein n=1 Tax=Cerasicoccus frondis TaxID=490090 RepID=UPI002852809B|nr:hypothetical protein [Cerasicoccus frondis]
MVNDKLYLSWSHNGFSGHWDLESDLLEIHRSDKRQLIWQGALLPALWILDASGQRRFVKAEVRSVDQHTDTGQLDLVFPGLADGELSFAIEADRLHLGAFSIRWFDQAPKIISIYVGAVEMGKDERNMAPNLDRPFWPAWRAFGACIPTIKTGPIQSFVRMWDLGHSRIGLGNFAPAMGSPYGAAYPRPLLACGMGGDSGWVVFGFQEAPDGALSFVTGANCGCLEILYREDLWGPIDEPVRTWNDFLHICWAEQAVDAYAQFYYPEPQPTEPSPHQLSMWSTWGDFKEGIFDLKFTAERARRDFGVDILIYDDPWETFCSSGDTNYERFPDFDESVQESLNLGLKVGFWHSVGWLDRPEEFGLGREDLLCGVDGEPRVSSWSFNPFDKGPRHFALDPSSPKSRQFLIERTRKVLAKYPASLLKLDFYYGLPGPDVAVPRDPQYRGEKLGIALINIIAREARRIRPDITILCYGLHPLIGENTHLVALDDLGDASGREAAAHGQWSFWATIAGRGGRAINGSSGYDWGAERDVVLNSAVIGAPGGILPLFYKKGLETPKSAYRPRRALAKWFRRTVGWRPLWLNSHLGDCNRDPEMRCWGRLERFDGTDELVALALRGDCQPEAGEAPVSGFEWSGDWAIIAQDQASIGDSSTVAFIPVGMGELRFECRRPKRVVAVLEQEGVDAEEEASIQWANGVLALTAGREILEQGLLGYLVHY